MGNLKTIVHSVLMKQYHSLTRTGMTLAFLLGISKASAIDTNGLVAEFVFDGQIQNRVSPTTVFDRTDAKYVADRFGISPSAMRPVASGYAGSTAQDYIKNQRQWTWAGWVRLDDPGSSRSQMLYSEGNRGVNFGIGYSLGGLNVSTWNEELPGNWRTLTAVAPFVAGKWHHVAVTLDTPTGNLGQCIIYLDGESVASGAVGFGKATDWRASVHEMTFGDTAGAISGTEGRATLLGALDDVLIFNRVISGGEVKELFNAAAPPERLSIYNAVEIEFFTQVGKAYQLQSSVDALSWRAEGAPFKGDGLPFRQLISIRERQQNYWRIMPAAP